MLSPKCCFHYKWNNPLQSWCMHNSKQLCITKEFIQSQYYSGLHPQPGSVENNCNLCSCMRQSNSGSPKMLVVFKILCRTYFVCQFLHCFIYSVSSGMSLRFIFLLDQTYLKPDVPTVPPKECGTNIWQFWS